MIEINSFSSIKIYTSQRLPLLYTALTQAEPTNWLFAYSFLLVVAEIPGWRHVNYL